MLPNPWDAGSAVFLETLGFKALATTSGGMAFSRGLPDRVSAVSRDAMLAHVRQIVEATSLPVNVTLAKELPAKLSVQPQLPELRGNTRSASSTRSR